MGKKRIIKGQGGAFSQELKSRAFAKLPKKKLESGTVYIRATYNNTAVSLTDKKGNMIMWSSSGMLGFKGAKKGTPFAASKVAETVAEKAKLIGVKEVDIEVRGVGGGRESALRTVGAKLEINSVKDTTPVPHNGPRAPKPRRV